MPSPSLRVVDHLADDDVAAVHDLVRAVQAADGVAPLSEHVLLHLPRGGDDGVRHVLAGDNDRLVGYAHLDVTDEVAGSSAELAVHPDARRAGVGRALARRLLDETPDGRLRLWAHGEHPAAAALAADLGFARARVLLQMRRPLDQPLPDVRLPDGVTVRTFVVGQDERAWVELNARAFADHPEQGRWTAHDLHLREREPWFDAAGFFLAERDGRLVGFHWTKVHGGGAAHGNGGGATHGNGGAEGAGHAHEPIGEVYVVGVDPAEQGRGLGPALTLLGLHHLRDRGLPSVLLYVDESNTAAVKVYERLGFTRHAVDISFARG